VHIYIFVWSMRKLSVRVFKKCRVWKVVFMDAEDFNFLNYVTFSIYLNWSILYFIMHLQDNVILGIIKDKENNGWLLALTKSCPTRIPEFDRPKKTEFGHHFFVRIWNSDIRTCPNEKSGRVRVYIGLGLSEFQVKFGFG